MSTEKQKDDFVVGSEMGRFYHRFIQIGKKQYKKFQDGRYRLREKIGIGSFATVYRARHRITNVNVALKFVRPNKNMKSNDKFMERLNFEVDTLMKFRHPNIIRCYEKFEWKSMTVLVLEFVEGLELFDYIVKKQNVHEKKARKIFHQLVSAVEYIHKNFGIHRDLKPENILISGEGHKVIKVVDFGLGNKFEDGEFLDASVGSPNYAAPEVIDGTPYDTTVDIWSMGCILYALVGGRLPFDGSDMKELFENIRTCNYPDIPFFSKNLRRLISRMLQVDSLRRISLLDIRKDLWYDVGFVQNFYVNEAEKLPTKSGHDFEENVFKETLRLYKIARPTKRQPNFHEAVMKYQEEYKKKNHEFFYTQPSNPTDFIITYHIVMDFKKALEIDKFAKKWEEIKAKGHDPDKYYKEIQDKQNERIEMLKFQEMGQSLTGPKLFSQSWYLRRKKINPGSEKGWDIGLWVIPSEINAVTPQQVFDILFVILKDNGCVWARYNGKRGETRCFQIKIRYNHSDPYALKKEVDKKKDYYCYGKVMLGIFKKTNPPKYHITIQYDSGNIPLFYTYLCPRIRKEFKRRIQLYKDKKFELALQPVSSKNVIRSKKKSLKLGKIKGVASTKKVRESKKKKVAKKTKRFGKKIFGRVVESPSPISAESPSRSGKGFFGFRKKRKNRKSSSAKNSPSKSIRKRTNSEAPSRSPSKKLQFDEIKNEPRRRKRSVFVRLKDKITPAKKKNKSKN